MTIQERLNHAAELLRAHDDFMLLTHIRPDGDTLGSAFALREALEQLGKRAFVANDGDITPKYAYLNGGSCKLERPFEPAYVVSVDVASTELLGATYRDLPVDLVLDHHRSGRISGRDESVVCEQYAAAGELIYELLELLNVRITEKIAQMLYTAIATDTGCFKFSNTTAHTHRVAASLLEPGYSMSEINQRLFMTKSRQRVEIEAEAYKTLRFYEDGAVASVYVTLEMKERFRADEDDIDELSSIPRSIEGVEVGIAIKQVGPEEYKISLRSNGKVDASKVCGVFGGGGHLRAAGCTLTGELEDVERRISQASSREYRAVYQSERNSSNS